ncbi:MAG TPA: thiol-disulfide oxidoreductase DCC family protein [Pyrinomonadaceae bacterium]|nr:thiol-disulfide oxidoreductase DCC family protein [Pyrinomonadaceae bacterium]
MGAIVLFDGICNFCDSSVNFIIEHDTAGYFKFAPLQSDEGRKFADKFGFSSETAPALDANGDLIPVDSVVLIENDRAFAHSDAALRIIRRLGLPWSLFYSLILVPRAVRDYFYKLFAKNRYRFFGKKDQCMLPSPEIKARFLT